MNVKGTINSMDLQKEFENTLMTYGDQHIKTPLTLANAEVLNNVLINVPVNGVHNLSRVATLHGRQVLQSPLYFKEVYANDIQTNHTISGININDWTTNALWLSERAQQLITGNWTARKLIVKAGPQLPVYLIDGLTNTQYDEYTRSTRNSKKQDKLMQQAEVLLKAHNQLKMLKYLEPAFQHEMQNLTLEIKNAKLAFKYLFINKLNCTEVFVLHATAQTLTHVGTLAIEILGAVFYIAEGETLLVHNSKNYSLSMYVVSDGKLLQNHTFAAQVKSLAQSTVDPLIFYAINDDALLEITLAHKNVSKLVKLPNNNLHLLPVNDKPSLVLCNNTQLLLLNSSSISEVSMRFMPAQKHIELTRIIKRLSLELMAELNKEMDIIENSLPDEHLVPDFMSIIVELEQEDVYGKHNFADINHQQLSRPETTAQIFAARSVQIMWPFIVEVKQLRDYMRDKVVAQTDIILTTQIMHSIGATAHKLLQGAFNQDNNNTLDMLKQHLSELEEQLKFILLQNELQTKISIAYFCAAESQTELMQLSVGLYDTITIFVVATQDKLLLFTNLTTGKLVQELPALKPHSLAQLRLGVDTLLAFVEDCCTVRVLIYRGSEGFIEFSSFHIDEPIIKLLSYSEAEVNYFVTVLSTRIVFYQVIM